MLVRPLPFPDELDRGYLGRVMRRNGIGSEKELVGLMRLWAEFFGTPSKDLTCLELLARVANLDSESFACKHTTLPLRRGIATLQTDLPHGSTARRTVLWTMGMRLARPGAYCCEKCVAEDLEFHGQSYWRREHQIPGRFWCEKHGSFLHYLDDESAFLYAPSICLTEALIVDAAWVQEARQNEVVQRFLAICSGLMDRTTPISNKKAASALRIAAKAAGFRSHRGRTHGQALREKMVEVYGRHWLKTVMPILATQNWSLRAERISGLPFATSDSSSVYAFALSLAILFESADSALNALIMPNRVKGAHLSETHCEISEDALVSAYLECKGSHRKIVKKLGASRNSIVARLRVAGLPNLSSTGGKKLGKAARAFVVEGKSWEESIAIGGVTVEAMQRLLRAACRSLGAILREIEAPPSKTAGLRRHRPHTPLELGAVVP